MFNTLQEYRKYFDEKVSEAKEIMPHWFSDEPDHTEEEELELANQTLQELYYEETSTVANQD